jgi:hypothetical protein
MIFGKGALSLFVYTTGVDPSPLLLRLFIGLLYQFSVMMMMIVEQLLE